VLLPDQDSNPNGNTVGYQPRFSPVGRVWSLYFYFKPKFFTCRYVIIILVLSLR
jgi:hypothetical protein